MAEVYFPNEEGQAEVLLHRAITDLGKQKTAAWRGSKNH